MVLFDLCLARMMNAAAARIQHLARKTLVAHIIGCWQRHARLHHEQAFGRFLLMAEVVDILSLHFKVPLAQLFLPSVHFLLLEGRYMLFHVVRMLLLFEIADLVLK